MSIFTTISELHKQITVEGYSSMRLTKHLPGQHDQKTHGRKKAPRTSRIVQPTKVSRQKVREAMDLVKGMHVTSLKIAELRTVDEEMKFGFDTGETNYGKRTEEYGALKTLALETDNDELHDLIEFEGLIEEGEHEFWQRHATRKAIGNSVGELSDDEQLLMARALDRVKEFTEGSEIFLRVDEHTLGEITDYSNEFLTQNGTGTSSGAYNPDMRNAVNDVLFGYDQFDVDTKTDRVPIYGYVAENPWKGGQVDAYGDIAIQLSESYKDSTTITLSDSLDHSGAKAFSGYGMFGDRGRGAQHVNFAPSPFNDPGVELLGDKWGGLSLWESLSLSTSDDSFITSLARHQSPYVEAQVHREIDFWRGDIAAIHVSIDSPLIEVALDDYPIVWEAVQTGIPVHVWNTSSEKLGILSEFDPDTREVVIP